MLKITVVSGKGGTGKTSLVACLCDLARQEGMSIVGCDCDVDAPNLHLLLAPRMVESEDFVGMEIASIDPLACTGCGICAERCRFRAIENLEVIARRCEGCGVCRLLCPADAVRMHPKVVGVIHRSESEYGPVVHGALYSGSSGSGRMVTRVREIAGSLGARDLMLIDGAPGTGCPVIASITGVDLVVIVTEPTFSAIHDLERMGDLAEHFGIPACVVLNKADLSPPVARRVREVCRARSYPIVGQIPYHPGMYESHVDCGPATRGRHRDLVTAISEAWTGMQSILPVRVLT